jgi:membrane associated rhomboid family serine protease
MNSFNRRPGLFGGFSFFPPVLKILLVVNIAVFLIQAFFLGNFRIDGVPAEQYLIRYFYLWPIDSGYFMPWQLITYMFLHGGFMHLFMNMFVLWMFGFELENIWGSKKFLLYYLMCGLAAAVANEIIAPLITSVGPTVGASGAIYGILAAFVFLFPNRPLYLYFMFPIKAKYFIFIYMFIDFMNIISNANTGIAHVAHLGGAVAGFIYLFITTRRGMNMRFKKPDIFEKFKTKQNDEPIHRTYTNGSSKEQKPKEVVKEATFEEIQNELYDNNKIEMKEQARAAQEKIDAILDKLSQGGYGSLTDEEKKILFHESKKLR